MDDGILLNYDDAQRAMRHIAAIELHLGSIIEIFDNDEADRHPLAMAALQVFAELHSRLERPIVKAFPEFNPERDVLRSPSGGLKEVEPEK